MIKIYNFPAPSRAVRPIWLCEEMGVPYEVILTTFPIPAEFRTRYAIGSVPYLEDEGVAMGESIAMLLYIAEKYGPTPLLPEKEDPAFARVVSLSIFSEATMGAWMNVLLGTMFKAPEDQKHTWQTELAETRARNSLDYASKMLGDGPFFGGERFTLADIAIGTSLGMWNMALGKDLPANLAAYSARLAERPAQQRAMKRARGEAA